MSIQREREAERRDQGVEKEGRTGREVARGERQSEGWERDREEKEKVGEGGRGRGEGRE